MSRRVIRVPRPSVRPPQASGRAPRPRRIRSLARLMDRGSPPPFAHRAWASSSNLRLEVLKEPETSPCLSGPVRCTLQASAPAVLPGHADDPKPGIVAAVDAGAAVQLDRLVPGHGQGSG